MQRAARRRAGSTGCSPGRPGTRRSRPRRARRRACSLSWHAPMRLLVTGGAGYIGSIVAQQLVARGDDVTVLDSLFRGHRGAVPGRRGVRRRPTCSTPTRSPTAVSGGFDGVLHFAAMTLVAESVEHPERYYRGNVTGTLNLLDAMRAAGVPRLVFSSTAATYGEPDVELISEDTPNRPVNAYGNSKLAVDRMITDECRAHGLAAVSLRYFNVGGRERSFGRGPSARRRTSFRWCCRPRRASARASRSSAPTTRPRTARPCATTSTSTISAERTCWRWRRRSPRAARHLQPGVRARLLGARGHRRRAAGDGRGHRRARAATSRGRPAAIGGGERAGAFRSGLGARAIAGRHGPRRLGVAPGAPGRLRGLNRRRAPAARTSSGGCAASTVTTWGCCGELVVGRRPRAGRTPGPRLRGGPAHGRRCGRGPAPARCAGGASGRG